MRGVLSPSGTRLAPTEAMRRPVACCFERPEQLQFTYKIAHAILKNKKKRKGTYKK